MEKNHANLGHDWIGKRVEQGTLLALNTYINIYSWSNKSKNYYIYN